MPEKTWNKSTDAAVCKGRLVLFEETVLPHLDAAYNLARWLARNEQDARDVVQESYLRALRFFDGFQSGRDARAWLLKIVRNTCYTWLRENRPHEMLTEDAVTTSSTPETELLDKTNSERVRHAVGRLAVEYREVLILREFEELSYKEIAQIVDVPVGTVMSRLSRGRKELQFRLSEANRETKK